MIKGRLLKAVHIVMIYSTQSVESLHFLVIRMGSRSTLVLCSGFGLCTIMFSIRGPTSASITITATLIRSGPPQAQAQRERLQQLLSADTFVFSWQLNKFRASIIILGAQPHCSYAYVAVCRTAVNIPIEL